MMEMHKTRQMDLCNNTKTAESRTVTGLSLPLFKNEGFE